MTETPSQASTRDLRSMVLLGLMMAGAGTVDAITANMLPITAKHFTSSIGLIAAMVALNRICGFLFQPYAAWKSDRHAGARGRRRPFLLVAWPAVFVSLAALGALPFVVPPEQQCTLGVVALLFAVNLVMQAFLDVVYGSGDPIYGDMFSARQLGRASGVRLVLSSLAGVAMTFTFVPLADRHEFWPYAGALVFVGASWCIARWFLRETIPGELPQPAPYDPLKPLAELRHPQTRHVALVASTVLVAYALTEMLHALFVTETLGFSKATLGYTTTIGLVVSLLFSYPVGWVVDRLGARVVLLIGFALLAVVEAAFGFWVDDLPSLCACLIAFKVTWLLVHVPIVPLMFANTPVGRRGSIFAAVQMTRAMAASAATVLAGFVAQATNSYRTCYLLAGFVCLIGVVGAARLAPTKPAAPVPVPA
jgi:MFS family permease